VGVSGLLVGLSAKKNMKAVSLLAETYGHPMYMGFRGAKEVINVLNSKFNLELDTRKLDREIKKIEEFDEEEVVVDEKPKGKRLPPMKGIGDMNYIG
jgi:proteasome assembly chaperone (PAC2) family protein